MPSRLLSATPSLDQSLTDLLRSYGLPSQDAERLVDLLASFGVSDTDYLRVLSRMATTDNWLRELREAGQLSEVQMRLLREILQRAADPA